MFKLRVSRVGACWVRRAQSQGAGLLGRHMTMMTRPLGQDLTADVLSLCKKWKGMDSKTLCKNCGEIDSHSSAFCHMPRISSLPCQLCYGLDLSSVPHSEMDCQGVSEANTQLYITLQRMLFLKRINGTISPRNPLPAAASGHGTAGNGGP